MSENTTTTQGLEERLRDFADHVLGGHHESYHLTASVALEGFALMREAEAEIVRLTADRDAAGRDYDAAVAYGDSLLAERNALLREVEKWRDIGGPARTALVQKLILNAEEAA